MSGAAEALMPLVHHLCGGDPPLRLRFWDGSELEPACAGVAAPDQDAAAGNGATLVISSPNALRRILWRPNELGLARAYVAGEIDVEGEIWSVFRLQGLLSAADRPDGLKGRLEAGRRLLAAARATGALGRPLEPSPTTTTSPTTSTASSSARR
jgi:cyclopropane-fatty-acyl-phospholipid synthase